MWRYLIAWLPMVPLAIGNGALRQTWYGRHVSELAAHQISTATALVLFAIYIGFVIRSLRPVSGRQAIAVGLLWLGLTVAFEFLFGHYVAGQSWRALLHDYHLLAGRLWVLVLAWLALSPYLFYRFLVRSGSR